MLPAKAGLLVLKGNKKNGYWGRLAAYTHPERTVTIVEFHPGATTGKDT